MKETSDPLIRGSSIQLEELLVFSWGVQQASEEAENSWLIKTNPERGWEVECPDISPVNSSADVQMRFWHNLNHKTWKQTWHYCVENEISPFMFV